MQSHALMLSETVNKSSLQSCQASCRVKGSVTLRQCTLTIAMATVIKCHSSALIVNGSVPYFALATKLQLFSEMIACIY